MLLRNTLMLGMLLALGACSNYANFEPRDKTAQYDPHTGELTMPYPCPDWSQSETQNELNYPHSNYGCAVNTNSALQVAEPSDLYRGHGAPGPDTEATTSVIQLYRAGKIPVALTPMQDTGTSSGGSSQ